MLALLLETQQNVQNLPAQINVFPCAGLGRNLLASWSMSFLEQETSGPG